MIRNVIFDMGQVLMWFTPQEACRAVLKDEGDAQALYDAYFGGRLWVEVDHGRLDGEVFTGAVKALLDERLHAAVDALYHNMPENILIPVAGMTAIVDEVFRRGFRVYLLSNAGRFMSRRRDVLPRIDRFDGVMFSGDEGIVKPDPRLYRRLAQRCGLTPDECYFIDDNEHNIRTAAALGWKTHLFTGDTQALRAEIGTL